MLEEMYLTCHPRLHHRILIMWSAQLVEGSLMKVPLRGISPAVKILSQDQNQSDYGNIRTRLSLRC